VNINISRRRMVPELSLPGTRHAKAMRRDLRVIRACALILVFLATMTACVAGRDLLAPTAIAITLALVLAPIARALERIRIPAGVASVVAVVATVSCLTAGAVALAPQATNWIAQAPKIAQTIERKLRPLTRQIAAFENASNRIAQIGGTSTARSVTVSDGGFISSAVRIAPSVIEKVVYITVLTIFLLAFRRHYTQQLILLPKTFQNRLRMARVVRDVRYRVSGYLFTVSTINVGLASVTAAAFYAADLSDPILWGIAFGLLNFIPIIGPAAIVVAATVFGLVTAKTVLLGLVAPLILLGLHIIEANLVQPWLLSRRIVVSPIAIFLTVVTLVWMWGPAAAITAVPLLIFFHTIAMHMPEMRPVAFLLASENGETARGRKRVRDLRKTVPAEPALRADSAPGLSPG
jgi:predicted PurR-regulated permease PerM